MIPSLLGILREGLKAWNTKEGKEIYERYRKAEAEYDEQMDRKSRTGQYSQLAVDRSLRTIREVSDAYYKYIVSNPTA